MSLASGFLCRDVLSLRLLLVGGYGGLVMYHALRPKPLLIPLKWSAFFVLVNASMAAVLVWDNLPIPMTPDEEELHVQNFAPLSRKQFRTLMDLATEKEYEDGHCLTIANQPCDKLYFIKEGTANLTTASGEHISKLNAGAFPNCMSFQRSGWDPDFHGADSEAYGTIRCKGPVRCLVWESKELLHWLMSDEDAELRMDHVVIEAVVRRLLLDPEGAKVKDYLRVISQGWAHHSIQQRKIQSMQTRASTGHPPSPQPQ